MSLEVKNKLSKIPVVKQFIVILDNIKLPWLQGISFYDLLDFYISGILQGDISYRAAAISFSFFMALFPFALFILNLIPYIPIPGFQEDFIGFVQQNVPPTTFGAVFKIINDILHNSYNGLLSTGFIMSVFLMTNGVNAIMSGFETSKHIEEKRAYFRQYAVALLLSVLLTGILLITVSSIVIFEVVIQKTIIQDVLSSKVSDKICFFSANDLISNGNAIQIWYSTKKKTRFYNNWHSFYNNFNNFVFLFLRDLGGQIFEI
jgi:membrane protein